MQLGLFGEADAQPRRPHAPPAAPPPPRRPRPPRRPPPRAPRPSPPSTPTAPRAAPSSWRSGPCDLASGDGRGRRRMGRLDLDPALLAAGLIRCREEALSDPWIGEGVAWSSIVVSMIDEVLPRDPGDERRPYPWSREEALRDLGESTGDAITIN